MVDLLAVGAVHEVARQVHRTQVAHRDFGLAGVERDLGAQVARVHHAHVLLRRAHIAGVLVGDPGVPGLEQHRQHLAPQITRRNLFVQLQIAAGRTCFIGGVRQLEVTAELVVQIGAAARREQRPVGALHDPLHEQIGDPVRGVHVVRASAVVAGVLAQLEKLFHVEVPAFEVRAHRTLALATLIDRDGGVVDHLQERHHTLALAVRALDVAAQGAHIGPVVAQASGELGQQGVFLQGLVDAVEVVGHGGQVAA